MKASYYHRKDHDDWSSLIASSHNGTFLHTRQFLEYHGDRFQDTSLVVHDLDGKLKAIFPAAVDPSNDKQIVSHPGTTYGGLVTRDRDDYHSFEEMMMCVSGFYRHQGYQSLLYKTVPLHFHKRLMEMDKYYLWQQGAEIVRRDVWNVILLDSSRKLSKGRQWGIKRALKENCKIEASTHSDDIAAFHDVLVHCLVDRHQASPVHSEGEMKYIMDRFPNEIELWLMRDGSGQILAGVWLFNANGRSPHTQYIATTQAGRDICAGDALLEHLIERAHEQRATHFSFGASTQSEGKDLNSGLFSYKSGFGFGNVVHDFYRLEF